jgi:hypothetical protein
MQRPPLVNKPDSICVYHDGKSHNIDESHPNFQIAKQAIADSDWERLVGCLDIPQAVKTWTGGQYEITDRAVLYEGEPIGGTLEQRMLEMMNEGADFDYLLKFHERLQANPSSRAVNELFTFLEHKNIPIGPDGCFYAYKGLRENYKDCYSGTIDNTPGVEIKPMKRNQVDDDCNRGCSRGYHVGSLEYAEGFSRGQLIIVKVDPANVVSVPKDCSCQKVRVTHYEPVSDCERALPSTVYNHEPDDVDAEDLHESWCDCDDCDDWDEEGDCDDCGDTTGCVCADDPAWMSQPRDAKGRFLPRA